MTVSLSSERRQQIDDIFTQAKALLTEPSPYWHVPIPVPIPSMARKIAGDILGWPLHLRNKPMDEDGQTAVVMPVMRHKPLGVTLLPSQPRLPKSASAEPSSILAKQHEPSSTNLVIPTNLGPNNPFALRSAFQASPPPPPSAAAATAAAGASAALSPPGENFVGARIRKHFDGRDLEGTVIREDIFGSGKFYLVLYDDGNQEHLPPHELSLRKL